MALTKEQLAARKIGGSMVPTILDLNPHQTRYELFLELVGERERVDLSENENVVAGNVLEDGIAELAQRAMTRRDQHEVALVKHNETICNPKYPWLTCHVDRLVLGQQRGIEIKNVGYRMAHLWGEPGTDAIPQHYLPQAHTYLLVTDYPIWTVAAYFGGSDLRLYEVMRDREMDQLIIDATHEFWYENVEKRIPPPLQMDTARALAVVRKIYPGTDGTVIRATEQDAHWRSVYEQASEQAKRYQEAADIAKAHLLWRMKDSAIMQFDDGKGLTRKRVERAGYTVEATSYVDARFSKVR